MMVGVSNNFGCAIASLCHGLDVFSNMPCGRFDLLELKDFSILKEGLLSKFPASALISQIYNITLLDFNHCD